jgi:hypothetical protein
MWMRRSVSIRRIPFTVGRSALSARTAYPLAIRFSMTSARVAGVPMPFSWSTAAKFSSSICLPAFSMRDSRRASVMRAGGFVSSATISGSLLRTLTPVASLLPGTSGRRPLVRSSVALAGNTARQPGTSSDRSRVRNRSPPTSVTRSTRSHTAGGWNAPKKRRATRSNTRRSSPLSAAVGSSPVGMMAK